CRTAAACPHRGEPRLRSARAGGKPDRLVPFLPWPWSNEIPRAPRRGRRQQPGHQRNGQNTPKRQALRRAPDDNCECEQAGAAASSSGCIKGGRPPATASARQTVIVLSPPLVGLDQRGTGEEDCWKG